MRLDFALLPMTELRNAPGEILDRVADKGEAFIIERNGKQKACLVPITLFFPDISPARIAQEMDELTQQGELPRLAFTDQRELSFTFGSSKADSNPALTILLPHGYPNSCPRVFADGVDAGTPHRWADGTLCLYGVTTGWNPGKHNVFTTLQHAREWVAHYQSWKASGQWPKEGANQ
jgi:prevent-host-death family protein